jgi:hypothetical protein
LIMKLPARFAAFVAGNIMINESLGGGLAA